MSVLVDEVLARLSSASVGGLTSTASWRLVAREFLPGTVNASTQAQQICVTPSGGYAQYTEVELDRPTFQVRIRGDSTGSTGLEQKVDAVIQALNLQGRQTLSGRVYLDIEKQGDVLWLGRDEADRPVYAVNFLAFRSRTT